VSDAMQRGDLAVVAIGRNEGERLGRCLRSVVGRAAQVIYVDSGSSDGSVELARALDATVVELDLARPFTAARARNAGWRATSPGLAYVQFVDGDCEVVASWLARAAAHLDVNERVAVVCGRRRERFPDRSIYNTLCDIEWDTPVGEVRAFGGDAMIRLAVLLRVGGYRDELIAGEEPELGLRLRAAGWAIHRLDAEMTLHDAAMTRFSQWWRRAERAGFAFAEGASLHGATPERYWVRESRSSLVWGLGVPLAAASAMAGFGPAGALVLLSYPAQIVRLALRGRGDATLRFASAALLVVGKFAEMRGALRYHASRLAGRRAGLIEYK
jgi:glycosyltransferase involved in cell wall biosynthesis